MDKDDLLDSCEELEDRLPIQKNAMTVILFFEIFVFVRSITINHLSPASFESDRYKKLQCNFVDRVDLLVGRCRLTRMKRQFFKIFLWPT